MSDTELVDPSITVRGMAVKEIWGEDQIQPRTEVYSKMAKDIEGILEARGQKRTAEDAFGSRGGPQGRRGTSGPTWTTTSRGRGGDFSSNRGRGGFRGRRPRGGRRGF